MSDNYNMLPNNSAQTIENNDLIKDSFVQLYGKRAIAYFKELSSSKHITCQQPTNLKASGLVG